VASPHPDRGVTTMDLKKAPTPPDPVCDNCPYAQFVADGAGTTEQRSLFLAGLAHRAYLLGCCHTIQRTLDFIAADPECRVLYDKLRQVERETHGDRP
jgi:hypothetical protein